MLNIFSKRNGVEKKNGQKKNVQFLISKKSFRNKFLLTPVFCLVVLTNRPNFASTFAA